MALGLQHAQALRQALRRLAHGPLAQLFSVLVIALSLALPALLYRAVVDLSAPLGHAAGAVELTVFLPTTAGTDSIARVRAALAQLPGVARLRYVSPDEALDTLKRGLPEGEARGGDLLAGLGSNPLPPAFVVEPREHDPARLKALRDQLAGLKGVDLVQLDSEWAGRLYAFGQVLQRGVLGLAVVLLGGVVTVVVNTLRLQILAAREEIEVCKLIGASHAFVRRPFLYFGVLQMVLGAGLALLLLAGATALINRQCAELLDPIGLVFRLRLPDPVEMALLVLGAAVLGAVAAAVAVALFLRRLEVR